MNELNLALNHEQNGILMYEKFALKFQNPVFSEILTVKKAGFELLKNISQTNGANENSQNFSYESVQSLNDALFLAISYEIKTAILYDEISSNLQDENQKDMIFRLWATSQNEYKAALQNELNKANNTTNSSQNLGEFTNIFQKFANSSANADDISKILSHPYASFFTGAALGGVAGVLFNQILGNKDE